jgi:hypothetical protein
MRPMRRYPGRDNAPSSRRALFADVTCDQAATSADLSGGAKKHDEPSREILTSTG